MSDPYYVTALKSGDVWANNGTGVTLTYNFWQSLPSYYSPDSWEANDFEPFTAAMKTATQKIFDNIGTFANVSFREVFTEAEAQLGFAQAVLSSDAGGWAYYPDSSHWAGDVWTNSTYVSSTSLPPGSYSYYLIMHEIGHALGLQHTFETDLIPERFDNANFSAMSYKRTGMQTYGIFDIAALQSLYGANMNYAAGDDVYRFNPEESIVVWDAGGYDTFDASSVTSIEYTRAAHNYANGTIINLTPGLFSQCPTGGFVGLAYGVWIEKVIGSTLPDLVTDNEIDNDIRLDAGNDIFNTTKGNDFFDGGTGFDEGFLQGAISDYTITIIDNATLTLSHAEYGLKTITNTESFYFWTATIYLQNRFTLDEVKSHAVNAADFGFRILSTDENPVSSRGYEMFGTAGNDTMTGTYGDDKIVGGDGNDILDGGPGRDRLDGGAGDDTYIVDSIQDVIVDGKKAPGIDLVEANASFALAKGLENLTLIGGSNIDGYGNKLNNEVTGNGGDNTLYGDKGNDTLCGGAGSDTLYGGKGSDRFVIDDAGNVDTILDFSAKKQPDTLDLHSLLTGFNGNLSNFVQFLYSGGGTIVQVDQNGTGSAWVHVATINGILDAAQLYASSHLIV